MDDPIRLFILRYRLLEEAQERFGIRWVGNDSGMKLHLSALGVKLAEVNEKFEGIVADFEVVGITPL
jgi:hypothetical protein